MATRQQEQQEQQEQEQEPSAAVIPPQKQAPRRPGKRGGEERPRGEDAADWEAPGSASASSAEEEEEFSAWPGAAAAAAAASAAAAAPRAASAQATHSDATSSSRHDTWDDGDADTADGSSPGSFLGRTPKSRGGGTTGSSSDGSRKRKQPLFRSTSDSSVNTSDAVPVSADLQDLLTVPDALSTNGASAPIPTPGRYRQFSSSSLDDEVPPAPMTATASAPPLLRQFTGSSLDEDFSPIPTATAPAPAPTTAPPLLRQFTGSSLEQAEETHPVREQDEDSLDEEDADAVPFQPFGEPAPAAPESNANEDDDFGDFTDAPVLPIAAPPVPVPSPASTLPSGEDLIANLTIPDSTGLVDGRCPRCGAPRFVGAVVCLACGNRFAGVSGPSHEAGKPDVFFRALLDVVEWDTNCDRDPATVSLDAFTSRFGSELFLGSTPLDVALSPTRRGGSTGSYEDDGAGSLPAPPPPLPPLSEDALAPGPGPGPGPATAATAQTSDASSFLPSALLLKSLSVQAEEIVLPAVPTVATLSREMSDKVPSDGPMLELPPPPLPPLPTPKHDPNEDVSMTDSFMVV